MPALEAFPDVIPAWAFGSARDGELRLGSDLDIATLVTAGPSLVERADLREALQTALGVEAMDLVVLPTRSLLLAMEAVCGRCLLVRDPDQVAVYVSQVAREAEDETAFFRRDLVHHPDGVSEI
ncbi:MAG: nucleotidyltransferase domain-containing protein [Deferrisomatales bacterium]|nr:nucleotidyltransferase domain-containing protein [Deferrisomatales bacterium]